MNSIPVDIFLNGLAVVAFPNYQVHAVKAISLSYQAGDDLFLVFGGGSQSYHRLGSAIVERQG